MRRELHIGLFLGILIGMSACAAPIRAVEAPGFAHSGETVGQAVAAT